MIIVSLFVGPLSQWDGQKTKESRKERRPRTVFTGSQLLALESVYQSQRLLCRCERARLAGALALTPAQVKVMASFVYTLRKIQNVAYTENYEHINQLNGWKSPH